MRLVSSCLVALTFAAAACARGEERAPDSLAVARADSIARARQDSINRAQPGYVVDSAFPPEEALRRFRATLTSRPESLSNGAPSRDALVQRWVKALESNDSLALIRMAVNRPEYAWLVYPESPLMRPATHQPPDVAWMLLSNGSVQGFRRTLNRLGGAPLGFVSYRCDEPGEREGEQTVWRTCTVRRVTAPGDTAEQRLFGAIVARRGHFKFLSLANDL